MFEKYDSLNRQKWMVTSLNISVRFMVKFELIFAQAQENDFFRGFI